MTASTELAPAGGHTTSLPIYFDDLDSWGIVHNTRYALFIERALSSFWNGQGYGFANGTVEHPDAYVAVAEVTITYRAPIRGTGGIHVNFWAEKIGDTSIVYAFRILSSDEKTVHAEGRRVHIRIDPATLRPTAWAPETREIYETLRNAA